MDHYIREILTYSSQTEIFLKWATHSVDSSQAPQSILF